MSEIKKSCYNDPNYVGSRNDIPDLLNKLGLFGMGIEIGVQKGLYSEQILEGSKLSKLYICDSWKYLNDYIDTANVGNEEQEKNFNETKNRLLRFEGRVETLRMLSDDACKLFSDETLDFVYIDANHRYEYVLSDIKNWYPKVMKGCIISGHDFFDGDISGVKFGVRSAVIEFFKNSNIYVTEDDYPSWYVLK